MAWPVTRLILRTDIRSDLSDSSATAAEQDFSDTTYNEEIDRALRDVGIDLKLPFGAPETTVALVAGQVLYSAALAASFNIEQLRLQPTTTTNLTDDSIDRVLKLVSQEELRNIMGGGDFATEATLGHPVYWCPEPRGAGPGGSPSAEADVSYSIWPAPSAAVAAAFSIRVRQHPVFARMVADASVMQLPPGCDTAIVKLVGSRLAAVRGDGGLSARLKGEFVEAMARVNAVLGADVYESTRVPMDVFGIL